LGEFWNQENYFEIASKKILESKDKIGLSFSILNVKKSITAIMKF